MDIETRLQTVESLLQPWTATATHPEANRCDVVIDSQHLHAAVQALKEVGWGYLSAISGLDCAAPAPAEGQPAVEGHLEVLYHFCDGPAVLTIRVSLPYADAILPSVCDLLPYATLYERELMELLGVRIEGTPNSDRLVLPDEWPDGVYPLRKAFTGFAAPATEGKE
ncbi:NADH dehydrogenase subunit C [Longilinea arvoryzae]|uniref:NADH dehydrogenase subunit C n=1 Tax=Longilinea arvoryzae TaxID=360412 RepID=A0A0S7BN66_9CHLR|nr:NADH-quinone oxidoreductase subunit C [Longilinea arvoryzae]GAP15451.1 NADH dehydrogenase subunit C [Longilinea arvoryzae]